MTDVTNYFPNPATNTLADATRPKHMGRFYFGVDTPEVTQVSLDGGYVVKAETTAPHVGNGMMLQTDGSGNAAASFGLATETGYLLSVDVIAPAAAQTFSDLGDWMIIEAWGYISYFYYQTSDAPPEPGERVRMHVPFIFPVEAADDFSISIMPIFGGSGGYVYFDNLSICEATVYLEGLNGSAVGNSTIDLSALGVTPGGKYLLSIYHEVVLTGEFANASIVAGATSGSAVEIASIETGPLPEDWDGWTTQTEFTVPSGADYVAVVLTGTDTATDAWRVTVSDAAPDYFDGDTADAGGYSYAWTGTSHDSTSVRSGEPTPPAGPAAQVWVSGAAKNVAEMRVVVAGTLIPITEAGA